MISGIDINERPLAEEIANCIFYEVRTNVLAIFVVISLLLYLLISSIMSPTSPRHASKKASPLKAVNPIIRKYSGHRKRIKKNLKLARIQLGNRTKLEKSHLKLILPKPSVPSVYILPDFLPRTSHLQLETVMEEVTKGGTEDVSLVAEKIASESVDVEEKSGGATVPVIDQDPSEKCVKKKLKKKKHLKNFKNIESNLGLLDCESLEAISKREDSYTVNYLQRVQQRFNGKEDAVYNQFVNLVSDFQLQGITVTDLYKKIQELFALHPDLTEDFIPFLTPEQSMDCGVFMEHLLTTKMTDFLRMVDLYFSKSPHQIMKIHSVLESLSTKLKVTTEDVSAAILPLLKGSQVLTDYFMQLLPHGRPPENFLLDFEDIEYQEVNSDYSGDEDNFETIHLPETEGLQEECSCLCTCHLVTNMANKYKSNGSCDCTISHCKTCANNHCKNCSVKYINGKVFKRSGKNGRLRLARVEFRDHDLAYHQDRLAPKLKPKKRVRKRSSNSSSKENLSPTKSCNLSSDEFKSDIEEEDKGRMKSPRMTRNKSLSPKARDKTIPRNICNELEVECKPCNVLTDSGNESGLSVQVGTEFSGESASEAILITVPSCSSIYSVPNEAADLFLNESQDSAFSGSSQVQTVTVPPHLDGQASFVEEAIPLILETIPIIKSEVIDSLQNLQPPGSPGNTVVSMLPVADPSMLSLLVDTDSRHDIVVKEEIQVTSATSPTDDKSDENPSIDPWKIEEDRIILQTLQVEEHCDETFLKISSKIPSRGIEDIKQRFKTLMSKLMLFEMKAKSAN